MIRAPFPNEWNTSQIPNNRRIYLDSGLSFEEITSRVLDETGVIHSEIKSYEAPARGEPRDAQQVIFLISVGDETCDLFYNAPDGLRGRYWQSPDHGCRATGHLIAGLVPTLISFAERVPPSCRGRATPMTSDDIRASLQAPSAKIWPRERADDKNSLLVDDLLMVQRWVENELLATVNKCMWRLTPRGGELEIKGAILGRDKTEYLPEGKRDRSYQIFRFGFT
jgi:hypothetical protein